MKNKKNRLTAQSPSIFQRFSYLPSKDEFEKKQKENDINQVFELLPSKIVNPPISAFRKKTQPSINFAYKSRKKSYSINFLNILDKQEEASKVDQFFQVLSLKKLKVACELCKISPLERSNDEILGLVKVTSYLKYFEEMNRKKWHKNEQVHERCCALLDYEFLVKGSSVFNQGEKPKKFYIILKGSVVVLIPKTAEKFLSDKDKEETCRDKNSYDFSYLINLKSKKKLKLFEKNLQISNEYYSEGPIENEEENKITRKEKIQNTMKRFSELTGGLDFLEIQEVEKLFQDGILKYTFYREIKAGDHFGDLGIIRDKPRSATIICKENCSFGILKSEEFKSIFAVVERKKFDEKIDFFKKHLIRKSNENDLVKFSYAFEKRKSTRNEILYKEGDIVKEVFFIKKGEVQLYKLNYFLPNNRRKEINANFFKFGRKLPLVETNIKEKKTIVTLLKGEFFGEEELFESTNINNFEIIKRKFCVIVTSSKATIYTCPIEFFVKFIQERPHFKNNFKKIFETRKSLRDDFLRYSSYGESETFLKMANMQMLDSEINFRKSVDDIYYRLKTNPSPTERKENSETTQIFSRKSYISCKNKSNPPPLSFHDKVVCKIKFNKNQKTDNIEHKQLFWNQKIGNRKLMKHLQEITSKYHTQKNEESRMTKTNLSIKRLLTNGDKNNEKDNIDQILIASQNSSSKNTKLMAPFNSKKLNSYSLDPFLWTSKSDI